MNNLGIFLSGFVCALFVDAAISWLTRSRKRSPKAEAPSTAANRPAAPENPPQRKPAGDSQWQSLPGGRLELGATGFYITINPSEPTKVYQGFTPEHLCIVTGPALSGMKRYLEECARERAEFDPPDGGWAT